MEATSKSSRSRLCRPAAGRSLADVNLLRGALIIVGASSDSVSTAETILEPGNRYLVTVEAAVNDEVMTPLRGERSDRRK